PQIPIGLMPPGQPDSIGIDVGWLGFPNIEPNTLCFFAGTLSARQEARKGYLIDGVAINGVSGGPVFHCPSPEAVQIIGCVSAYACCPRFNGARRPSPAAVWGFR